jgi:hypothetical protein
VLGGDGRSLESGLSRSESAVCGRDSPGAPEAVRVIDRVHLVDNLRAAAEVFLRNQRAALQAAAARTAQALTPPGSAVSITPTGGPHRPARNGDSSLDCAGVDAVCALPDSPLA